MNARFIATALALLLATAGVVYFVVKSTSVTKPPSPASQSSFTATPDQPGQTRIRLFGPSPGDHITSPIVIYGQATNLYQDTLTYKILDAAKKVLAQGTAKTSGSSANAYANYSISAAYTTPTTDTGTVEVVATSASGATLDDVSIPVKFH